MNHLVLVFLISIVIEIDNGYLVLTISSRGVVRGIMYIDGCFVYYINTKVLPGVSANYVHIN